MFRRKPAAGVIGRGDRLADQSMREIEGRGRLEMRKRQA
jgi:hypothetical protein